MLKVKVMKGAGYCQGVQRAITLVERALDEGPHPVWTLGPVVHNPIVGAELAAKGLRNAGAPEMRKAVLWCSEAMERLLRSWPGSRRALERLILHVPS